MIRFIVRARVCVLVIVMAVLPVRTAFGQVVTGAILGRVTDSSGAVVAGAMVTATNVNTGLARTDVTDRQGEYAMRNLPLGEYTISVSQSGFQKYLRKGIQLTVGSEQTVNVELTVGSAEQTVQVTAEAPSIETTNATVSNVVNSQQIRDLPLNGRSVVQLALLSPGTFANPSVITVSSLGMGMRLSVDGGRMDANTYLLDGSVINDQAGNGPNSSAGGQALGVEGVLEFRLLTHNYSAEYGRSSGAIMSMVTRGGTNEFHGSAYEFLRNSAMDARNFFNPGALPPFRRNQFGASLGGPIKKDRLFFFFNYEGLRIGQGITVLDLVPDALARQGLVPNAAGVLQQVTLNPAVLPFLALYPLPNGPDVGGGTGLYTYNASQPANEDYYLGRIDYRLSDKDSLYGRYVYDPSSSIAARPLPQWYDSVSTFNGFLELSETHIFSPTALNEFRAAYNRTHPSDVGLTTVPLSQLPDYLPGVALGRIAWASGGAEAGGLPTSLSEIGYQAPGANQNYPQNLFEETDSFSLTKGAHSLKFGGDFQRIQLNLSNGDNRGTFQFGGLTQFLAGTPSRFTDDLNGAIIRGWRNDIAAWFVQDDWRIRPNLTLNLGLRHEFGTDPLEIHGYNADLLSVSNPLETIGPPFHSSKKNFAPRVGIAWDPTGSGKTSIRAGGGLYYNLWENSGRNWYMGADALSIFTHAPYYQGQTVVLNPPFPNPLSAVVPGGAGTTYSIGVNGYLKEPTVAHFNFDVQRQLVADLTLRVAYVGAYGYNMGSIAAANLREPTTLSNGQLFFALNAPYPNPNFVVGGISLLQANGHYNYNGLQVELDKRLSKGLQMHLAYTWSKALSDSDEVGNAQTLATAPNILNPLCMSCDYGLSAYNQQQTMTINGVYNMPWDARLQNKAAKAILGGWALNGIVTWGTGMPVDIETGLNQDQDGDNSTADRPNLAPGANNNPVNGVTAGCAGIPAGQQLKTATRWYDPCAFSIQTAGTYGNLGRNTVIGPGLFTLDAGLVKNIPITERIRLAFRAEAFNLTNHTNLGLPGNTLFTNSSGARNTSAGIIGATSTANRQLQLALKLVF